MGGNQRTKWKPTYTTVGTCKTPDKWQPQLRIEPRHHFLFLLLTVNSLFTFDSLTFDSFTPCFIHFRLPLDGSRFWMDLPWSLALGSWADLASNGNQFSGTITEHIHRTQRNTYAPVPLVLFPLIKALD